MLLFSRTRMTTGQCTIFVCDDGDNLVQHSYVQ